MVDENQRRVCGPNCIYSAAKRVNHSATAGEMVQYDFAPDPAGGIESFANIVLP
jgi:hypothetical protein